MYDNATKDTWRGWAWNQVQSRVPPGSRVLVLCGDIAGDLKPAIRRGYEVVGVDLNPDCVDTFRINGGVAIKDNASAQIALMKPDACILDFKNGFNQGNMQTVFHASLNCKCVVANFLRGRDDIVSEKRGGIPSQIPPLPNYRGRRLTAWFHKPKHRGAMFVCNLACLHQLLTVEFGGLDGFIPDSELLNIAYGKMPCTEYINRFCERSKTSFNQYKSKDSNNVQVFDSFALNSLLKVREEDLKPLDVRPSSIRKAAAAKAVLTKRRYSN